MTTIFKSDKVATDWIADISGIKDPDYLLSANFTSDFYKLNGARASFADIINFSRSTEAYKLNPVSGIDTIPVNTPVFNDPVTGEKGLWSTSTSGNAIGNGIKNQTETVTFNVPARIGSVFRLQVFGTGSVTVSGDVVLVDDSFTTTANKILRYRTKANSGNANTSIVTYTVAGNVIHYQTGMESTHTYNYPTINTVSQPTVLLQSSIVNQLKNLDQFVMLVRIKNIGVRNPATPLGLFEISTSKNLAYGIINTSNFYSCGASDGINGAWGSPNTPANVDTTIVVKYEKSQIKIFKDGALILTKSGDASSILEQIIFFRTSKYETSIYQLTGLLKNLAIFSKPMTDQQLVDLSNNFEW